MADYEALGNLIIKNPKAAPSAFKSFKQALEKDDNDKDSYDKAYKALTNIVEASPKLTKNVLEIIQSGLQNKEIRVFSLKYAYSTLKTIVKKAKEVSDSASDDLPYMNAKYLSLVYKTLDFICLKGPGFRQKVLELVNIGLQKRCNNTDSLHNAYHVLYSISLLSVGLAPKVLDSVNTSLLHRSYDGRIPCDLFYMTLECIVDAEPKLAPKILDTLRLDLHDKLSNDESTNLPDDFSSGIISKANLYGTIIERQPELVEEVWNIFNSTMCHRGTYDFCSPSVEQLILSIIKQKPELAKEVARTMLRKVAQSPFYMEILSSCSQKAKLDELLSLVDENAPKWQEKTNALKAAYALRFSTADEIQYALEKEEYNYDTPKISQIRFSAQQRCLNVLMNELGKENGVSKEESMSYRLAPNDNELYKNNKDWLVPASFKAAEIFGCYFPSYIKMAEKHLSIHDAVYWLPEKLDENKKDSFTSFVQRNLVYMNAEGKTVARPLAEMEIISKNWNSLKPEEEKLKYKDILAICRSKKYAEQEYENFAAEAAKWGVSEEQYKNFESVYKAGLSVPEPFDSSKEFKFGAYTGRFLPRDDVRAGFFGGYTDCCQHFNGVGKTCAISTIKDPYSQLFVIENKDGRIISGSWVWENSEGKYRDVCFDNIEAIGDYEKNPVVNKIYDMVGKYLTNEASCHKVTIGVGYQDADISKYAPTESIPLPQAYGDKYSDAKGQQVLLCENKHASELDKTAESKRFIRDICFLDEEAMDKVSEQCFPEGDQTLMMPDRPSGLALVDEYKGVVGYCLYDKDKKHIYDMAVLPEYRKDKNASSGKLFAETMRRVKELGGEWHAELRDKTTYRYLEVMVKRGLVTYETHGVDHEMSDGSKVYAVSFKPVSDERTAKRESNLAPSLHGSTRE